jgi:glycosyltransferase involved in cell wall biosynthesis
MTREMKSFDKKRIVILCPWYAPYRTPLLRELSKEFDITVIYSMSKETGREWNIPENLPFKALFLQPIFLWKTNQMFGEQLLIRYPSGLLKTLKNINPDVVIGLEFRIECIVGLLWSIIKRRGYVTWSDMTLYHDIRIGFLRKINRKCILSRSHALIGSCTDTINHFCNNFGYARHKSFLSLLSGHIHEHVSLYAEDAKDEIHHDGMTRFVYIGELIPRKGVDLLIHAFSQLIKRHPKALLTLVGKGIERKSLENLTKDLRCEKSVIFKGSISYEAVLNEMRCHDVFVLPCRLDVFGLVVAEAIACGLPVICSMYAGVANDLVQDNGFIIDPHNIEDMIAAMEKMANDPQMRERMSISGKILLQKSDLQPAVEGYTNAVQLALQSERCIDESE